MVEVDEDAARAAGIRRHEGQRLTLYTDLGDDTACESLLATFDAAYPQWCRYFHVPVETSPTWHVTGCLMLDRERFRRAGLLPAELPEFLHGYTYNDRFWFDEQPSEYYRRHLMLHEGTHSFMLTRLGSTGPAWYAEGIAERLGTHRGGGTEVELGYFPRSRDEVPMLGRIKLVRDDIQSGRLPQTEQLLNLSPRDNSGYAWAWAWACYLDSHPRYRERFRALIPRVGEKDFNDRFVAAFRDDLDDIDLEWASFATELDYGRDLARTAVDMATGKPLAEAGKVVTLATDRGWQSTGVQLEPGSTYALRAKGRYQISAGPPVWWCESGGVTIRYHRGAPLGMLQGAIVPDPVNPGSSEQMNQLGLDHPIPIGLGATVTTPVVGTLYLRVNDSPAELSDNVGTIEVEIRSKVKVR
ncbi:MAG: hypothetical protein KF708_00940 [Pirellulales bacterium]|nr:hypothetical protein [Pirellulales bacterium]